MVWYQRKFFKAGLPLIIFIIGASFAQKVVTQIRYTLYDHKHNLGLTPDAKKELIKKQENIDQISLTDEPFVKAEIDKVMKAVEELKKSKLNRKPLNPNDPEDMKKLEELKKLAKRKVRIEDEYNKMRTEKDLNNWENKRIPRPWNEEDEK